MLYRVSLVGGGVGEERLHLLLSVVVVRTSLSLMSILTCEGAEEVCKPQHDEKIIKQDNTMGH